MTDLHSQSDAYFASLNPLTKKIMKDVENFKKTFGEEWTDFSPEKQEELLDKFLIDPRVAEKYSEVVTERPEVFPNYRIDCGEKIVVDFDNEEGWTWRDEHSGPFSWRTRSQQDLTLDDFDEGKDDKKARSKRSRSPEREGSQGPSFRNDKSTRDTPYMTAEQEKNETEEEIFRKFGITFSADKGDYVDNEEESGDKEAETRATPQSQSEGSTLLPAIEDNPYEDVTAGGLSENLSQSLHVSPGPAVLDTGLPSNRNSIDRSSSRSHKKKKEKEKHRSSASSSGHSKRELPEAEQALIPELSLNVTEQQSEADVGQVSPVYVEEPGESYTDTVATNNKFDFHLSLEDMASGAITVQPSSSSVLESPLDEWKVQSEKEETKESDAVTPSTGFDFLDNW